LCEVLSDELSLGCGRQLFYGRLTLAGLGPGGLLLDKNELYGLSASRVSCAALLGIMLLKASCNVRGDAGLQRRIAAEQDISEPGSGHWGRVEGM